MPPKCSARAELVQTAAPSEREALLALAATWKRLAKFEADARLLQALGDLHLGSKPYEALLLALNIGPCEKGRSIRRLPFPTGYGCEGLQCCACI